MLPLLLLVYYDCCNNILNVKNSNFYGIIYTQNQREKRISLEFLVKRSDIYHSGHHQRILEGRDKKSNGITLHQLDGGVMWRCIRKTDSS
jgi:hypothetical protein